MEIFLTLRKTQPYILIYVDWSSRKNGKGKGHPCTGTEALYRPYGS